MEIALFCCCSCCCNEPLPRYPFIQCLIMVLCRQLLMCLALISKEAMYTSMSLLESVHTSASEITGLDQIWRCSWVLLMGPVGSLLRGQSHLFVSSCGYVTARSGKLTKYLKRLIDNSLCRSPVFSCLPASPAPGLHKKLIEGTICQLRFRVNGVTKLSIPSALL